jgi:hypothetical protein
MTLGGEVLRYRIAVVQSETGRIGAIRTPNGYCLPRAVIPFGTRQAKHICESLFTDFEIRVLIIDSTRSDQCSEELLIAELLFPECPERLDMIPLDQIDPTDVCPSESSIIESVAAGRGGPVSRIGWVREAALWLEAAAGVTLRPLHTLEQYNAGGAFSLIRFHAEDGSRYWLKSVGEPNTREFSVTSYLSKIGGDYLPRVVASRPEWRAWITAEEGTDFLAGTDQDVERRRCLCLAATSLAELQLNTITHINTLLTMGASDQRASALSAHEQELSDFLIEAMSMQTSTKVPRLDQHRIRAIFEVLQRTTTYVASLGLPDTVLHGDMNPGNILYASTHCQFIDWSNTYVGMPLITLEHLSLLVPLEHPRHRELVKLVRSRYRETMATTVDPDALKKALIVSPILAAASTLYGRGDWLSFPSRNNPRWQSFTRTLARHLDRMAHSSQLRSAIGL